MGDSPVDDRLALLIDAALQRYMRQIFRRYGGVVIAAAVLAVLLALVPSRGPDSSTNANAVGGVPGAVGTGGAQSESTANSSGTGSVVSGPSSGTGGPTAQVGPGLSGETAGPGAATAAAGVARSGVECGADVRQVSFTAYAAPCVPSWSGDNGGATSHGVTEDEITVVFRKTASAAGSDDATIADLQVWIDLFNKNYETYGRKVVLKVFDGQGGTGTSAAQEQADAQTAHDLGAFADMAGSAPPPYFLALANKGIISLGLTLPSQKLLDDGAPYLYAMPLWPSANNWGYGAVGTICDRMIGLPAVFAGDPVMQQTKRVFGLTNADSPDWGAVADIIKGEGKAKCGLNLGQHSSYTPGNGSQAQTTSIIAQMKAAGVTTVLAPVDILTISVLMQAADSQNYYPEWLILDQYLPVTRLNPPSQIANTIKLSNTGAYHSNQASEAWKAYQISKPGGTPGTSEGAFGQVSMEAFFFNVLQLFNGIQAAGPNLTPETFSEGWKSLPRATGMYGLWRYGPGSQDPAGDFVLSAWDPNKKSEGDGGTGEWTECNGGARYEFPIPASMGSGQLDCLGANK